MTKIRKKPSLFFSGTANQLLINVKLNI